jgi:hypothetical protein
MLKPYLNKDQIPYLKTEPLHIVFRSKATLGAVAGGYYDWSVNTTPVQPTPNGRITGSPRADLDPANLYVIESFTFSADLAEADYSGAIVDDSAAPDVTPGIPRFHLYVQSESTGPILKQPIPVPQYYQESSFPKWKLYTKEASDVNSPNGTSFLTLKNTNQFQAAFEGRLIQTPSLIGKGTITLIVALNVLEIKDENFIREYRRDLDYMGGRK